MVDGEKEKQGSKRKSERTAERQYWWNILGNPTDVQKLGLFKNEGTVIRPMYDQSD